MCALSAGSPTFSSAPHAPLLPAHLVADDAQAWVAAAHGAQLVADRGLLLLGCVHEHDEVLGRVVYLEERADEPAQAEAAGENEEVAGGGIMDVLEDRLVKREERRHMRVGRRCRPRAWCSMSAALKEWQ